MTMTDDPRAPTRAEIIAAADQVALKVFFSGVKGEDLTVGVVRDAALETLTEFAAQARAEMTADLAAARRDCERLREMVNYRVWILEDAAHSKTSDLYTNARYDEALCIQEGVVEILGEVAAQQPASDPQPEAGRGARE